MYSERLYPYFKKGQFKARRVLRREAKGRQGQPPTKLAVAYAANYPSVRTRLDVLRLLEWAGFYIPYRTLCKRLNRYRKAGMQMPEYDRLRDVGRELRILDMRFFDEPWRRGFITMNPAFAA